MVTTLVLVVIALVAGVDLGANNVKLVGVVKSVYLSVVASVMAVVAAVKNVFAKKA